MFGIFAKKSSTNFVAAAHPKTGNTWLRFTLGHYTQAKYGIDETIVFDKGDAELLKKHKVFAIGHFSHEPLEWETQLPEDLTAQNVTAAANSGKVILLVRNPLDTMVSLYMHEIHRTVPRRVDTDLITMVRSPVFGLPKFFRYYSLWAERMKASDNILLWRYEDAKANPAEELRRVVSWLGDEPDEAAIKKAVDYGSFDNMKQMESERRSPVYRSSGFKVFSNSNPDVNDAMHIRNGMSGAWRSEIPAEYHDELIEQIATHMPAVYRYDTW